MRFASVFLVLISFFSFTNDLSAASSFEELRLVQVRGTAKKKLKTDLAICSFSVINEAKTPEEARSKNELNAKNTLNALRKLNIADTDINLESFTIEEVQEYNQKEQKYILKGYKALRSFSVNVSELNSLAKIIASLTQNGTNTLNKVSYALKDPELVRLSLLKEASLNAKLKAEAMLSPLNSKIVHVQRLSEESNFSYPSPRPYGLMAMAKASSLESDSVSNEAYSSGVIEIVVNVDASFLINP